MAHLCSLGNPSPVSAPLLQRFAHFDIEGSSVHAPIIAKFCGDGKQHIA